jgi:glycosyltransferase involved in cell wall biosynthesis
LSEFKRYVLWLPSWYPNRLEPYNGDFIKRQAEALSLYDEVRIIFLVRDKNGIVTKDYLKEEFDSGSLQETIIYYSSFSFGIGFLDKFFSARKYKRIYHKTLAALFEKKGTPAIVHVQIGLKAGLIAQWVKKKFDVPYVLTEHWSGFLEEADDRFQQLPAYAKNLWKRIVKNASAVSAVSSHLASALKKIFQLQSCEIIPNVVNGKIFFPGEIIPKPQFVHISGLAPLKKPEVILKAFAIVNRQFPDATLEIFGSEGSHLTGLVSRLKLENSARFHAESPQQTLADAIRNSLALILYSAYETFGCVIIEANACGVPVLVSDIPVFHETVKEAENGFFAGNNDPVLLARKMSELLESKLVLDKKTIAEKTMQKYSFETVGKKISDWYKYILDRGK